MKEKEIDKICERLYLMAIPWLNLDKNPPEEEQMSLKEYKIKAKELLRKFIGGEQE